VIRVLIAEDYHLVRQGLVALLERESGMRVVGEASNGLQAVELAEQLKPDVVVMDINMPGLDGLEATRRVCAQARPPRVLVLSMYSDGSLVKKAFRNGASGYLVKNSVVDELLQAVQAVSRGETFLSPALAGEITLEEAVKKEEPAEEGRLSLLSDRELEVFKLAAEGRTNQAIAFALSISIKTVEKHRSSLMHKLGVTDSTGLVREAVRHKIIFVDEQR
jgi:DNA-binding NarL/FixJ family response regulator